MPTASRMVLRGLAALYLAGIFLQGVGCDVPKRLAPKALLFFLDVAALFPDADGYILEYRAEGFLCAEGRWAELDPRPYFPMNANNKESRFQRALFLYPREKRTFRALEAYLLAKHGSGSEEDGIEPARKLGGIRFLALREPIPEVGTQVRRFTWRPLATYPHAQRHTRYQPSTAVVAARCGNEASAAAPEELHDDAHRPGVAADAGVTTPPSTGDLVDGG
jgi:hypothetical protein